MSTSTRIALVTGGAKGLGLEWCRQLGRQGYQVILTARSQAQAEEAADQLNEEGLKVVPHSVDVVDETQIAALAAWVAQTFGRLDLLVNNAGVNSATRAQGDPLLRAKNLTLEALDPEEVLFMLRVNAIAPILMAKHFRSLLTKGDAPVILHIGSWLGSIAVKKDGGNYSYAVSKSALNMLNRALAFDLQADGIIAVVVNPGWVQTSMGGSRAMFTPEQAVGQLINNVLQGITLADTGKFFNYDGTEHPW
ncbi:MAG: SDR family oxidoreductase [Lewinellaceae bacterium]|nr:SDR family oxidoreductase [Lewinellaceae bacterium]